jgi:hypothetical protein
MTFTAQQKLQSIERELGYRRRVYARLVDQRKMNPETRNREIAIFESIAEDYRKLAAGERLL